MFQADYFVRAFDSEVRGQIRLKDKKELFDSLRQALDFETPNGFDELDVKIKRLP